MYLSRSIFLQPGNKKIPNMNTSLNIWSHHVVIYFSKDEVEGSLEFKHVELPDPLHNGAPLLSQLNVKVNSGQTLAIVPLDNEKINPFELLLERFFDPFKGALVSNVISFCFRFWKNKTCLWNAKIWTHITLHHISVLGWCGHTQFGTFLVAIPACSGVPSLVSSTL